MNWKNAVLMVFLCAVTAVSLPIFGEGTFTARNDGLFGGQILALIALPDGLLFAGTYFGAGLYYSRDGGKSWIPAMNAPANRKVHVFAASPDFAHDKMVFATGFGSGVSVSTDRGMTWKKENKGLTSYLSLIVPAIAVSPDYANDGTVFIGTYAGLYMTSDRAGHWTLMNERFAGKYVYDVAVSPDFPRDRTLFIAVGDEGVYRSSDAGKTWAHITKGMSNLRVGSIGISPGFARDMTLFAGSGGALYISKDGGESWDELRTGGAGNIALSSDFVTDSTMYFVTGGYIYRSTNGGKSFSRINTGLPELQINDIAISEDGTLYAATHGAGVYIFDKAKKRWQQASYGIVPQVMALAVSPTFSDDHTLFTGTWGGGIYTSHNEGISWEAPFLPGMWVEGLAVSPNYAADGTVYAATSDGVYRSSYFGHTWEKRSKGITNRFTSAIVISPAFTRDRTVFVGTRGGYGDGIFKTTDGGKTWTQVNTGILDTVEHASVWALNISPNYANDKTVFVGLSYNSGLFRSTDGGAHWTQVISRGDFFAVAVSPDYMNDGTVITAAQGDGLYRSRNRGDTWEKVLSENDAKYIYAISFSPDYAEDSTIYAAAGAGGTFNSPGKGGVWRSTDGGTTWKKFSPATPALSLEAIAVDPTDPNHLFLGSCKSGVWEYTGEK